MGSYKINPANASIDIDGMTLDSYELLRDKNTNTVKLKVKLSGGLGRITIDKIGTRLVDENISIEAHGIFSIDIKEEIDLFNLVLNWKDISPPLRFLDFGDRAMLLEDGDKFIVIPRGFRDIQFDMPVNPR